MSSSQADYKVGSLTSLLNPDSSNDGLKSLFKSRAVLKPSKKNEDIPKEKVEEKVENGQEEPAEFSGPSRRFKVKMEDSKDRKHDPEKEKRTVFVGNLPVHVTVKSLKRRFKEFGEIETVRLRGAARPDLKTTKKVAVIKRQVHENRHNINAYIRFKVRAGLQQGY